VSYSSVFEQIRTTNEDCEQIRIIDENGGTHVQEVSYSPVFEQIRTTDENGGTHI
jgi:hypothetical protein